MMRPETHAICCQLSRVVENDGIIGRFNSKNQEERLDSLTQLAQQLKKLPKDKSPIQKSAEVINKVGIKVIKPYAYSTA
jgi:hypothetical protein